MDAVQFACPYCRQEFPADAAGQGGQTVCPHCGRAVTVPTLSAPPPPPPPAPPPPIARPPAPEPTLDRRAPVNVANGANGGANVTPTSKPIRRRSPGERQRYRRTMSLVFAVAGLAVLIGLAWLLLRVR